MKYLFIIFFSFSVAIYLVRDNEPASKGQTLKVSLVDSLNVDGNATVSFVRTGVGVKYPKINSVAGGVKSVCIREITRLVPETRSYIECLSD